MTNDGPPSLAAIGRGDVHFAIAWPAHFEVMVRVDALDTSSAELRESHRLPFIPEPTSVMIRSAERPCVVIQASTRATPRSRSSRWSAEEALAETAVAPARTCPCQHPKMGRLIAVGEFAALLLGTTASRSGDAPLRNRPTHENHQRLVLRCGVSTVGVRPGHSRRRLKPHQSHPPERLNTRSSHCRSSRR